jgi:hypothetical protein
MVFQGIGRSYWTVSWTLDGSGRIVINQLSKSNVHLTKHANQRENALFQHYGNFTVHRRNTVKCVQ